MTEIHRNQIITPHENDVLSGRGKSVNAHLGNKQFRDIVRKQRDNYYATPKSERALFAKMLVNDIRHLQPSGRFLKQDSVTKLWSDIGNNRALEKTRQAFREGGGSRIVEKPKNELLHSSMISSIGSASSKLLLPILGHQIQVDELNRNRKAENELDDDRISSTMGSTSLKKLQPILGHEVQMDDLNRGAENLMKRSVLYGKPMDSNAKDIQHSFSHNQYASIAGEFTDKSISYFPHRMAHKVNQHDPLSTNIVVKEAKAIDCASVLLDKTQRLSNNAGSNVNTVHQLVECAYDVATDDEDDGSPHGSGAAVTTLSNQWKADYPFIPFFDQDESNNDGNTKYFIAHNNMEQVNADNDEGEGSGSIIHDPCSRAMCLSFSRRDSEVVTKMEDIVTLLAEESSYADDTSLNSSISLTVNNHNSSGGRRISKCNRAYSKEQCKPYKRIDTLNSGLINMTSQSDSCINSGGQHKLDKPIIAFASKYSEGDHKLNKPIAPLNSVDSEGQCKLNSPLRTLNSGLIDMTSVSNSSGVGFGRTIFTSRHHVSKKNASEPANKRYGINIPYSSRLHHGKNLPESTGEKESSDLKVHTIRRSTSLEQIWDSLSTLDIEENNADEDDLDSSEDNIKRVKRRHSCSSIIDGVLHRGKRVSLPYSDS